MQLFLTEKCITLQRHFCQGQSHNNKKGLKTTRTGRLYQSIAIARLNKCIRNITSITHKSNVNQKSFPDKKRNSTYSFMSSFSSYTCQSTHSGNASISSTMSAKSMELESLIFDTPTVTLYISPPPSRHY
ncbi:hypothetical protein BDF14DRAFT_1997897 [Spinellus fusiger]|nr:hypothetical protein BDF14DRAFT_1997897 [Spinellus fusiger]